MDAVILAGGRIGGAFARRTGVTIKALLELEGRPLLERTVTAVRGSRYLERICVIGPNQVEPLARQAGADLFVREQGTGIDNLIGGVAALEASGRILVSASDLPFLRSEDVDQLITCTPPLASLSYAIFTRGEWEAAFPGAPATFFALRDGDFTGGCLFVLDAPAVLGVEPQLQHAFRARKSPISMARILGARMTTQLILGRLHRRLAPSTEDARRRVQRLTGVPCAVARGCSPRIKADVDNWHDWRYARSYPGSAAEPRISPASV